MRCWPSTRPPTPDAGVTPWPAISAVSLLPAPSCTASAGLTDQLTRRNASAPSICTSHRDMLKFMIRDRRDADRAAVIDLDNRRTPRLNEQRVASPLDATGRAFHVDLVAQRDADGGRSGASTMSQSRLAPEL
jgi:hypothetical protein